MTSVHSSECSCCSACVATVNTCHVGSGAMIDGHMKEFHCETTVMSRSVARIGRFMGSMIDQSVRQWPAPSSLAASSTSLGTPWKFCRRRKIA